MPEPRIEGTVRWLAHLKKRELERSKTAISLNKTMSHLGSRGANRTNEIKHAKLHGIPTEPTTVPYQSKIFITQAMRKDAQCKQRNEAARNGFKDIADYLQQ